MEPDTILTHIPTDLIPREQWPEYPLEAVPPPLTKPERVGINPVGIRWGLWPIYFEEYVSDMEPDMAHSDPKARANNRIMVWRRIHCTDRPKGWYRTSSRSSRIEGYSPLEKEYWRRWSKTSRQARQRWLTQVSGQTYTVRRGSYSDYERGYAGSTVARTTRNSSILLATQIEQAAPNTMMYLVAERLHDGAIHAGIAITNSPSTLNAYYTAAYHYKESRDTPLMIGLMDAWHSIALRDGYKYLHMGEIWQPGKPRAWKGFSTFKRKLGLVYIVYPPLLWRFVPGKFW